MPYNQRAGTRSDFFSSLLEPWRDNNVIRVVQQYDEPSASDAPVLPMHSGYSA